MLLTEQHGENGPLLLMIHWLGGSTRSWNEVGEALAPRGIHCVAVDLPGFGQAASSREFSITTMVDALISTVRTLKRNRTDPTWFLAGHSMGGKLAAILARHAEDGAEGLDNLRGVVLLSPSPPGPEPMQESKRAEMLQSLGPRVRDDDKDRAQAEKFVEDNTGKLPLLDAVKRRSVDDVLRMNPDALAAWLTAGSKEDWSRHVDTLHVPVLVLAGTEEKALGPEAQKVHTLQHFANATLCSLEGGGHLSPLERPYEVADRMLEFFRHLGLQAESSNTQLGADFSALIASDRTSPQTRSALLKRLNDTPSDAGVLNGEELRTLRALAERVIPDAGFDLAARLNQSLAQGKHDGWRFATLPGDIEAWRRGLLTLDRAAKREFGVPFVALDSFRQDTLLERAQAADLSKGLLASMHLGDSSETFTATQMRDWFEDVRAELAKLYVADPRTMERIGFTGFADEAGLTHITLGEQMEVEP